MRPYLEKTHHKNGAGGVAEGEGPEFKPHITHKKKKKKKKNSLFAKVDTAKVCKVLQISKCPTRKD
jgi:hypothetical protein